MTTNDESKEGTYYAITPIKYNALNKKPLVQIDGHVL